MRGWRYCGKGSVRERERKYSLETMSTPHHSTCFVPNVIYNFNEREEGSKGRLTFQRRTRNLFEHFETIWKNPVLASGATRSRERV